MFHLFIKNSSKKVLFILLFFTIGCSSNAKESNLNEINKVHCFDTYQEYFKGDFITESDEMFTSITDKLKKHENIFGEYNLIVTAGPKNDSSYSMIFNKAIIKKSLLNLYFDITQQEKSSIAMTAITYPVCLLHIENINKYELKILIQ